ncbi:MAG: HYR domain-containing protein [Saprospiraceae bacterium]
MSPDDVIDYYSLLTANANPAGQFSVTSITGSVFGQNLGSGFEYNGGCGTITVRYQFADDCNPNFDEVTISISQKPDVGAINDPGPLCVTDGPVNLFYSGTFSTCWGFLPGPPAPPIAGFPTLGVFAGPGVTDLGTGAFATFDPAAAGEGVHQIIWSLIDPSGICTPVFVTTQIIVRAAGDPTFTIPNEVCLGDVQANGGIPLALANPHPSLDENSEVVWYGGLTGDVVDNGITGVYTPSQAGTYTICVQTGDADCAQTYCEDIIVHENANATLAFTETTLSCIEPLNIQGNHTWDLRTMYVPGVTTEGGIWQVVASTSGLATVLNEELVFQIGDCVQLTYTVTTAPGAVAPSTCFAQSNLTLRFTEEPEPSFDLAEEVCWDGIANSITLPTVYNGTTHGTGGTIEYLWTATPALNAPVFSDPTVQQPTLDVVGAGTFQICLQERMDYPVCGGMPALDDVCAKTTCHTLTIHETNVEVIAAWTLPAPQCISGAAIDLDALVTGNPDGVFTGEGVELDPAHPNYRFNPAVVVIPVGQDWVEVSVCYTVGNGAGCDATECHTIRVYDDVDATINDIAHCMDANTQIDLSQMYGATTDTYGTFALVGQSANAPAATVIGDVLSFAQPALNIGDFTYTIQYTVGFNPPNGNCMATDQGVVTIENDGPTNTFCPPSQVVNNDPNICGALITYATPLFADECDGAGLEGYIVEGLPTGNVFPVGVTTVRWHYTDEDGNGPVECAFTITVNDTEVPHALCQDQITVVLAGLGSTIPAGNAFVTAAMVDAGSWDNCIGTEEYKVAWLSSLPDPTDPSDWKAQEGTTCDDVNSTRVIVMRVVDLAGNVDTCHANVAIKDYEAPDVECPGNIYVETDPGVCSAVVNYAATVSDNCMAVAEQTALFGGPVNGTQEVPASGSAGVGTVSGDIGIVNGNLNLSVNVSGLTGTITAAHIHAGAPGANGPVIFNLVAESTFPIGGTSVNWTAKIEGMHPTMVANNVLAEILAGNAYVNIHTTTNPGGEVRGQLTILYNSNIPSGGVFPVGTTVVAFEGYETQTPYLLANTDKCQFLVTVVDAEMPVLSCDPTLRTNVNDAGLCSFTMPGIGYDVTATDNCGVDTLYHDYTVNANHAVSSTTLAGATFPVGITDVIWTAIDAQGNKASCTIQIEISDVENPTITNIPADMTVDCGSDIPAVVYPNINDNCLAIVDFSEVIVTDSSTDEQILLRTWNVIDPSGNTNSATQTITINDNIAPVASNVPSDVTVDCGSDIPAVAAPTFVDNCSEFTVDFSEVIVTDSSTDEQVLLRTWVATDAAGNSTTVTQTITINDNIAPVASNVPSDVTVDCGSDIPAVAAPTFTDNCDEFTVDFSEVIVTDSSTDEQVLLRTWVATDAAGNSTTVTQTITINDNINPTITNVPQDITVQCASDIPAVVHPDIADNCDEVFVDFSETLVDEFSTDWQIIHRTWVATDAAGNQTTATQVITVLDTTDPVVVSQPADVTVDCGSDIPAIIPPVFTDNCNEFTVDFSEVTVADSSTDEQIIVRTWVATDDVGNSTTVTQTITINDNIAPVVVSSPADVTVDCGSDIPAVVAAVFTDNCDEFTVDFSEVIVTDSSTDEQVLLRTWVATDAAGNSTTVTQTITINDDIAPVASNVPANASAECGSAIPPVVPPTFTDNCDEFTVDFSEVIVTDSSTDEQVLLRTWVATDAAGNSTTVTQTITINDNTAPVIANVPADVTVNCGDEIPAVVQPTITDNCDEVFVDFSETVTTITFGSGIVVTRTWVATDAAGNTSTAVQVVTVDDTVDPTIVCSTAPTSFGTDDGECSYKVTNTSLDPTADDNCDVYTITHNYAMAPQSNSLNGAQFPVGQTQVGFTVTDAAGNTAECSITIDVIDDEDPTFVNCPTTMVMVGNDVDVCSGKLNWSIPVATDNCGIQLVAQTGGPAPGTAVPVGTAMTVTYTATDVNGNTSACTFDVQVIDTQKPEFDADIVMPGNITVQCDNIPAPFVLTNDDVYDNCTASADLVINFTEVSTQGNNPNDCGFYNYTITRTWTVTDLAGNVRTHIQVITVVDTTPPVPTCTDQTITLDLFGNASIDPVVVIAGTTDNCAAFANLTVTASQVDFDCSDLGSNSVTLTIMDPCGNTATCTINVEVLEGAAPCIPEYDPLGSDPCVCLDNATTLDNGQFGEVLQIQSLAGQTWTVQSSIGLYSTASPAPPAAPIPLANGTVLSVVGNGTFYRLEARHVDAIGFSVTLVNNIGQVFTFSNTCHYPTPDVELPLEICLGTDPFVPVVTDLFAGAGAYNSVTFMVDGNNVTQVDPAGLGLGQHTLKVTVNAGAAAPHRIVNGVPFDTGDPKLDPGCTQSTSLFFNVVTTPSQVTCNDLIHLTIQPQPLCESEITPDQVLEGGYACYDDYFVELFMPNGGPLSPSNVVTANQIGVTLIYQLMHPISGNICWGQILVEDKNAPTIVCPPNVSVLCTIDPDSVVHFMSTPVGVPNPLDYRARDYFGNLVPSGSCDSLLYFGHPTVDDCSSTLPWDCGGRTWTYNDDYTIYECAQNPAVIADIVRTFIVEDKWGNYSSCEQRLTWERGEADQVDWPSDYHIACNDPFLDDLIASNYDPYYTGWPAIYDLAAAPTLNKERLGTLLNRYLGQLNTTDNGICELGLTYEDQMVNICAKEWKIVRTWTLYDWCPEPGNPSITEFIQNIKVENVAPVINITCYGYTPQGYCILNATEPGNLPHYPCSAVYGPFADIDAGCDALVEVSVETELGNTTNGGVLPSPGLPIGGPYTITYRAEDQCGNITEYDLVVMVQDKTAPIAICDEITDVNLGILGQAVVDAATFDDGSYDGCALDHFLVCRMNSTCGSTSFAPTITFNCCDAANSPTMVVFRAVDHAGNTNDCMVEVVVNDKTPPILKSCPANERVSCDWYAANLETQLANAVDAEDQCNILSLYFGDAVYQDNCTPDVACTVSFDLDQCLDGTVRRTWIAEDASGNTNSSQNCNQTIFVDHVSDFVVEFPQHRNGEPTHLPAVECGTDVPDFGEPEIFYETCELVAVSYEDEVFTDVVDACYKIVRQWTVINWCVVGDQIDQEVVEESELAMRLSGCLSIINFECDLDGDGDCDDRTFRDSWRSCNLPDAPEANNQFGPDTDPDFDPWDGYITYQQVIKVNDTVDPVFTNGCTPADVCISDNTCAADITLPTPDIDECSSLVTFSVTSDFGTGFGPFFNVAPGVYNVRYVAMDNCNNQTAW